tara:strand:+ start:165 stop:371 length:207 start_codon:yes stop_codon:yes gene_type:complete
MSKIGFDLTPDIEDVSEGIESGEEVDLNELLVNELLAGILNPPEWQIAYEQTLFWAVLFNTHHKVNQC